MTIWKFELKPYDRQYVEAPRNARPLAVGRDPSGILSLWMKVDQAHQEKENVEIVICATGQELSDTPDSPLTFLGTVNDGSFMWHIFWRCP